ncbi:unnamed protein product [Microthlaspi erraticum]|uniref:Leucine-rich repeat-containing N-terminal plant-type domain-containing protein n=1 Tax=Microthlaspi erraticum TaxID=1685480 RepID=A0A6D2KN00_9BRAS|nr:unnamed protein product [Microthlaspi erraticum]CAA7050402.1 unnamed protein product [Microthlaspi erraticum]
MVMMMMMVTMTLMIVSPQVRSCIEAERKGLLELKAYVNISNSDFVYDWPNNKDSDCCRWERVKCNLTSGHVIGYKSLGKLKNLEVLDYSENYVNKSSVLPFLNAASSLKTLVLRGNSMDGIFPIKELKNLRNLKLLDLSRNEFIGPLPDMANFHKLEGLDLSNNKFSGSLEKKGICQLQNLLELDLSKNKFTGPFPQCFDSLTQLQVLDISSNLFSGTLPSLIGNLDSLEYLSLSDNEFEGSFSFDLIANLSKLKVFKLSSITSLLHVKAETSLQPKFQLSVLELQNCNLETFPSFLQYHKDLRVINLSKNKLTGSFPSWFLEEYPKLRVLLLQNNSFTMLQLPRLLLNHSLEFLDVSTNNFDQRLPENIYGNVEGNLPTHFNGQYMSLLYFNDNEFTGTIPSTLIKDVLVLDLRNNKLSGPIPPFVNNQSIFSLLLRGNALTGQIPTELCGLRSIRILDLAKNRLNGSIPSCLNKILLGRSAEYDDENGYIEKYEPDNTRHEVYSRLLVLPSEYSPQYTSYLRFIVEFSSKSRYESYTPEGLEFMFGLDLSSNELSGEIPKELGDLQGVRALNLSHNSLSGLIPESFSNLKDIESIDLSFNMLRGSIPRDLTKLDYMVVFNVSYNNLSGSIPSQRRFSTLDGTNFIGNPLLCGSALNKSCDDNINNSIDEETAIDIDMEIFYWTLAATYVATWMAFIVFLFLDSP